MENNLRHSLYIKDSSIKVLSGAIYFNKKRAKGSYTIEQVPNQNRFFNVPLSYEIRVLTPSGQDCLITQFHLLERGCIKMGHFEGKPIDGQQKIPLILGAIYEKYMDIEYMIKTHSWYGDMDWYIRARN